MYSTPPSDYILLPVDSHVGGRLFFYIYLTNISLKNTKPPTEMRPQRAARGGRRESGQYSRPQETKMRVTLPSPRCRTRQSDLLKG